MVLARKIKLMLRYLFMTVKQKQQNLGFILCLNRKFHQVRLNLKQSILFAFDKMNFRMPTKKMFTLN